MNLSITNFQIIESATLELSGITLLVGRSHNGKSSVYRSVEALLFGREGEGDVRNGTKGYALELSWDQHCVARTRTKGKTAYVVDKEPYAKIGKTGQLEFLKPLGVARLEAGTAALELNLVGQFDPLFFTGHTPVQAFGIASLALGENKLPAALVDVSDQVKLGREKTTRLEAQTAVVQRQAAELQQRREQLERVVTVARPVTNRLLKVLARNVCLRALVLNLTAISDHAIRVMARRDCLALVDTSMLPALEQALLRCGKLRQQWVALTRARYDWSLCVDRKTQLALVDVSMLPALEQALLRRGRLDTARKQAEINRISVMECRGARDQLAGADTSVLPALAEKLGRYQSLDGLGGMVDGAYASVVRLRQLLEEKREDLAAAWRERDAARRELKACPYCGSALSETALGYLVEHTNN